MKRIVCLLIGVALAAISARAAVVVLKNGERFEGHWVNVQNGNLTFKSDTLGQVTIPVGKIRSFSPSRPAVIVRNNKSTATGEVRLLPSGDWQVRQNGQNQIVHATDIQIILPQSDYTALVNHKAAPWQDWKGGANFGYNLQRGDQQTSVISANVAAIREGPEAPIFVRHFRTNYSLLMLFSKVRQSGAEISSNTLTTNLREDYLLAPNDFVFVSAELDHVQAQGLYLRQVYGGGFGRDLIHNSRTVFSVLGGLTFVNQKLYGVAPLPAPPATQSAELLLGEALDTALTKRIHFTHFLNFYPNLSNTGQYYFNTTSGLAMKLTSRFTANLTFVDNYLSNPPVGSHSNNVGLTVGLGFTF